MLQTRVGDCGAVIRQGGRQACDRQTDRQRAFTIQSERFYVSLRPAAMMHACHMRDTCARSCGERDAARVRPPASLVMYGTLSLERDSY